MHACRDPVGGIEQQSLSLPTPQGASSEGGETFEARAAGQPVFSVSGNQSGADGATLVQSDSVRQGAAEAGKPVFCRSGPVSCDAGETPNTVAPGQEATWMVVFKGLVNPHIARRLEAPSVVLCRRQPLTAEVLSVTAVQSETAIVGVVCPSCVRLLHMRGQI